VRGTGEMEFVLGLPGAGKGLFLSKVLWATLVAQRLPIITNLAVDLDKLQAWCDGDGNSAVRVRDWVRLLTEEESKAFWRVRRNWRELSHSVRVAEWVTLPPDMESKGASGKSVAVSCSAINPAAHAACYLIDEAQLHFASRHWRNMEEEGMWYFSQHRHFGDQVVLATQNLGNLDRVIRELGDEFHLLENLGKRSIRGLGKGKSFKRLSFYQPPRRGMVSDNGPFYSKLPVSVALGGWYSSSGGVGIVGEGEADTKQKAKGISPKLWVPLALAALVGVAGLGMYAPRALTASSLDRMRANQAEAQRRIAGGVTSNAVSVAESPAGPAPVPVVPLVVVAYVPGWGVVDAAGVRWSVRLVKETSAGTAGELADGRPWVLLDSAQALRLRPASAILPAQ